MNVLHIEPLRCNKPTRELLQNNVALLDFVEVTSKEELKSALEG